MLHSPVSDNKTKENQNKAQSQPETKHSDRSLGWIGYPALNGESLSESKSAKQRGQGWKPVNFSSGILQRKCACGNSAGSSGTCSECQSKEGAMVQPKLRIGEPGDRYEQEADRVADMVMRMPEPTIQTNVESGKKGIVQRKAIANSITPLQSRSTNQNHLSEIPPIVDEVLRSSGQPLDTETRTFMEPRFDRDFSQVRLHTDTKASMSAHTINAKAYTAGQDIVFAQRQYSPKTAEGQRLLAHELTHILQQNNTEYSPQALQRQENSKPAAKNQKAIQVIKMQEFIEIVKRIEATNPSLDTLEITQMISKTKYSGDIWEYLLPSTVGISPVTANGTVTTSDVGFLSKKLNVELPEGGLADPLHIIVALVAKAETKAPGAGGAGGWKGFLLDELPSGITQLEVVGWLGDVAHAAAEWMNVNPHPRGGTTKQHYMDEYAPESDLMADIDGMAMTSTSASPGGEFIFNSAEKLSRNLERFYFPSQSQSRQGKNRRFHIFCATEGFSLENDGVTLTGNAIKTIKDKVHQQSIWFSANSIEGVINVVVEGLRQATAILRNQDWVWFADKFIDFLQRNLKLEGS